MLDLTDLIDQSEAAALLGISSRTLRTLTAAGRCPQPVRFGSRGVRYSEMAIREMARTYVQDRRGPKPRPKGENRTKKRSHMARAPR
jgi:predicted DNA-binding transcriptional regulator AlpA